MKIALFGGSFDPFHTDHKNIIKMCLNSLDFDEVWILPTHISLFKKVVNISNEHRLNIINIGIQDLKNVKVCDVEINILKNSNTLKTVEYLNAHYPEHEFVFIMGSDQLDRFEEWIDFEKIIKLIKFYVFKRDENINWNVIKKYDLKLFEFENNNLSSTKIRNLLDLDLQIPEINQYCLDNLLFLKTRLKMSEKRFNHSLNVGECAKELAKLNNVDEPKAQVAGTLHDVAKEFSEDLLRELIKSYDPNLLNENYKVWHSFAGAIHLKNDWKVNSQEIISAVFNHTVANENMSTLDKIVFCADKISKERNYDNVDMFRQAVFKDLDNGFKLLLKNQYDEAVCKSGKENVGLLLKKACDKYLNDCD